MDHNLTLGELVDKIADLVAERMPKEEPKDTHDFSWALHRMKEGRRVRRSRWHRDGSALGLKNGEFVDGHGNLNPLSRAKWVGYILATDWELA